MPIIIIYYHYDGLVNKILLSCSLHLDSWLFTDNDDFFGGNTQSQAPLFGTHMHITYIFKPGFWLALSLGGVVGGKTEINGIEKEAVNNNSRYGITSAYKLNKNHSIKASFNNGFVARSGNDFNTFLIAYQLIWFNKN